MNKLVVLTLGDRCGVGPELVAKVLNRLSLPEDVRLVVVGDRRVLERGFRTVGLTCSLETVTSFAEARLRPSTGFFEWPFEGEIGPVGALSKAAGEEVLVTLERLAAAIEARDVDALVYAPLNKQAMRLAGHGAGDELDFLSSRVTLSGPATEINILGNVWTSRVTSHVPLRDVGALITAERVLSGIKNLDDALRRAGVAAPRLAVAALNPHAGEGGAFGTEEIDAIAPAVQQARDAGINAAGPFPSDSIFPRAMSGAFDGVVTMFHDQGQIALKLVGLGQGITLLWGLPVPVVTPGHGTAFDIAGTGTARPDGLAAAIGLSTTLLPRWAYRVSANMKHMKT